MDIKQEFRRMMAEQTEMALATSHGELPNVRIVNFYYDPACNIVYFSTFADNDKVKEIEINQHVAFTTIPHYGNEHVKAKGTAYQSKQSIYELADCFIKKIPDYQSTIDAIGECLILFEIKCECDTVTLDLSNTQNIQLN